MIKILRGLITTLEKEKYIGKIIDLSYLFYDEPKIFSYSLKLQNVDYRHVLKNQQLGGAGISFVSREIALIKCISEAIERLSLFLFDRNNFKYTSFNKIKTDALDPKIYINNDDIRYTRMNWVKGNAMSNSKSIWLPAQLIYLGYIPNNEKLLTCQISTGAAGGFTKESAILRGIYEIIERDTLMTTYLAKIKAPMINLNLIENKTIHTIIDVLARYKLKLFVFDITNDLLIPTFLAIIIDNSGVGPYMTIGYKSSINSLHAIIGSIEEAIMGRVATRFNDLTRKNNYKENSNSTLKLEFKKIEYLFNQSPIKPNLMLSKTFSVQEELKEVVKVLERKKINIYYADITQNIFKKYKHVVYKVIIPELQPYLPKGYKKIRKDRIYSVARYFGIKNIKINLLPHPFI